VKKSRNGNQITGTSLSRRRLLQASAGGAMAAGTSRFSFPSYARAQDANPLNDIFGPGGVEGGEGVSIQGGMNLAMTGQGAFFGDVMSKGALLAAEQIGAAGGPAITITINDHQSGETPPSVNGVRKLISQNKISFLQTSYGAPSEALIPILQQNKVLTFNGGGASPKQLFQDYLWMTRMVFAYDPTPGALNWLAENHPEAKRLATIGTLENGVEALEQLAPKIWPEYSDGGEIVAKEIHDVGLTDFSQVIARVKSSTPDAIFTVSFGNDLGYMVKQFREAAVDIPIVGIEFTQDAQTIAGELYDTFVFATDYYDTTNPNPWNVEFVKAHQEKYDKDPEYYGANYYEQVFMIWDLMRRVLAEGGDPLSGEALQQAMIQNPVFKSVYGGDAETVGEMSFDPEAHTVSKPMGVFAVKGGKPELLQQIPTELVPPTEKPA
jgi:branched-chain amino acid transport system substrate-binding protein